MNKRKRIEELEAEIKQLKTSKEESLKLLRLIDKINNRHLTFVSDETGEIEQFTADEYNRILKTRETLSSVYYTHTLVIEGIVSEDPANLISYDDIVHYYLRMIESAIANVQKEAEVRLHERAEREKIKEQVKKYKDVLLEVLADELKEK